MQFSLPESTASGSDVDRLRIFAWYPSLQVEERLRKPYVTGADWRSLFLWPKTHRAYPIDELRTHTFIGAPLSDELEKYPVLVFTHDLGFRPEYYTVLLEHLASEGFIIFCIQHAEHLAGRSILPFGGPDMPTIAPIHGMNAIEWQLAFRQVRLTQREQGFARSERLKQLTFKWYHFGKDLEHWARNNKRLINFLQEINTRPQDTSFPSLFFRGRLQEGSLSAIGHGWGGAVSAIQCLNDKRLRSVVNLNGFQLGPVSHQLFETPLLMVYAEAFSGMNDFLYFPRPDEKPVTIQGSVHQSFTDSPFWRRQQECPTFDQLPLAKCIRRVVGFLKSEPSY